MPTWTMTPKSIELYKAWKAVTAEYDAMLLKEQDGATVEPLIVSDVIDRLQLAYMAWVASMPRRDP